MSFLGLTRERSLLILEVVWAATFVTVIFCYYRGALKHRPEWKSVIIFPTSTYRDFLKINRSLLLIQVPTRCRVFFTLDLQNIILNLVPTKGSMND